MRRIFILFLGLGITLLLGGCGSFYWKGNIPNYEEELYTPSSTEITEIIIKDEDIPVIIRNSDGDNLYISYYCADNEEEYYEIIDEKGTIAITKVSEPNFGIFVFGDIYSSDSYKDIKLTVYVPKDYTGNISIETLDGNICIGDVIVNDLTVKTKDGNVELVNTLIKHRLYCITKGGNVQGIIRGKRSEFSLNTAIRENNIDFITDKDKEVEVITENGSIDITFDEMYEQVQ